MKGDRYVNYLTVVIISQCIRISKYHIVYHKYIEFLFVNHTSIRLEKYIFKNYGEKNGMVLPFFKSLFMSGLIRGSYVFLLWYDMSSGLQNITCRLVRKQESKRQITPLYHFEYNFEFEDPLKRFQISPGDPGWHFENHCSNYL